MKKALWALGFLAAAGTAGARDFPKPRGAVSDFAGVLDADARARLAALAADLESKTTAELAIVTVDSLAGDTVENTANAIFNAWGVGQKGKDNGVLILLAVGDRKTRIEVGYGLEGTLNDGLCGEIIRAKMIPEFKAGRLAAGLEAGAQSVATIVAGGSVSLPEESRGVEDRPWYPWVFGFVAVLFFGAVGYAFVLFAVLKTGVSFAGALVSGVAAMLLRYLLRDQRHPIQSVLWGGGSGGGSFGSGGGGFGGGGGSFCGGSSGGGGASGSW